MNKKLIHQLQNSKNVKSVCDKYNIEFCIIFGSYSTGNIHNNSDLDLAIYSKTKDLSQQKLNLIAEFSQITQKEIDLTILHKNMALLLRHEIMTMGIPIFISNKNIYLQQKFYAIKLFDDISFLRKWSDLSLSTKLENLKNVTANY